MDTVYMNFNLKLRSRTVRLELKHGFCFASLKLDGNLIDTNYFVGHTCFTMLLSETFVTVDVALTKNGYQYTIETARGIVAQLHRPIKGRNVVAEIDDSNY